MNSYKIADILANNPEMTNAVESAVNELYGTGNQSYSVDEPAAPNAAAAEIVGKENVFKTRPDFVMDKPNGGERVVPTALARYIARNEHYRFVKHPGGAITRFWYNHGVYAEITDDEIRAKIKYLINRWNPDLVSMRVLNEVCGLLTTDNQFIDESARESARRFVNFQNGLYDIYEETLVPHSPEIFSTCQIPCEYPVGVELKGRTPVFGKFMWEFCGMDKTRMAFLMEWLGVCLSNIDGSKFKKSLFIVGDGNSGKSVLLNFAQYLIGAENTHATDLTKLESRFGCGSIYNKRLIISPDQRFARVPEMSMFKMLTGGDLISCERKGKDEFCIRFDGFLWITANKLPRFGGDRGTHVFDRMLFIQAPPTVPEERRDHCLLNKMKAEAPFVCALALKGLKSVIERGYKFTEPPESARLRNQYMVEVDDVRRWLDECCVIVSSPRNDEERGAVERWKRKPTREKMTIKTLYAVYKAWCDADNNGRKEKKSSWQERLCEIFNITDKKNLVCHKEHGDVCELFILSDAAAKEFENWL